MEGVDPRTDAAARRRARRRKKAAARCAPPRKRRESGYPAKRRRKLRKQACLRRVKPRRSRKPELQPIPPPPGAPAGFTLSSPIAIYSGPFGVRQAERLLWRAGFGPSPGHAQALAAMGLHRAVAPLTRPSGAPTLTGLPPTDGDGNPLAPEDAWGHDHLWLLDRMVRTDQPLVERMTLVWHDWFATSNDGVGQQRLMLHQNALFRRSALGSFDQLAHDVTQDPAMILWLNQNENSRWNPNENYARELMELFTLGADRGAYTEHDVRELARALTGFDFEWSDELGMYNFRYVPARHDDGEQDDLREDRRVDVGAGRRDVRAPPAASVLLRQQALELLHPHAAVGVRPAGARGALRVEQLSGPPRPGGDPAASRPAHGRAHGEAARGAAGRAAAAAPASIDGEYWIWYSENAGQRLFYPPDVSGWDDSRWLDTSTIRGRFELVSRALADRVLDGPAVDDYDETETPEAGVAAARAWAGDPNLTSETVALLTAFAADALAGAGGWQLSTYRGLRQNALRHLVLASPDYQTS